jgi:hypothetical protein
MFHDYRFFLVIVEMLYSQFAILEVMTHVKMFSVSELIVTYNRLECKKKMTKLISDFYRRVVVGLQYSYL